MAVSGDELRSKTKWLTPAVLRGDRVVLRPHTEADIPRVVEACSDARTRQWLSTLPSPYTEDSARRYLDTMPVEESVARRVAWCVADRDTDLLLANLAIFDLGGDEPSSGELGYWTHPGARGRGVMTEAVGLVVDHALGSAAAGGLGLRRLQLLAAAGNAASAQVARRTGFVAVGRERQAELLGDGSYIDLLTFDLLSSDRDREAFLRHHAGGDARSLDPRRVVTPMPPGLDERRGEAPLSTQHDTAGFGPNEWLVEEMYQQYLTSPDSVDEAWHEFFADYSPPSGAGSAQHNGAAAPADRKSVV